MKIAIVAFFSGLVFAIGLGVSGMTDPRKVQAFLDVTGDWDPSLAFVMLGAIGVHFVFARIALRRARPVLAEAYALPEKKTIDARLLVGAALFGLGWGAAGYCPGPAIVAVVGLAKPTIVFFAAMVASVAAYRWWPRRTAA